MTSRRRIPRALPVPAPRPSPTGEDTDWRARGACVDLDPDLFFPDPSASADEALAACDGCLVRLACLSWALATREQYGVWGGTTEQERRRAFRRAGCVAGRARTETDDPAEFGGEAA